MAVTTRVAKPDEQVQQIIDVLREYEVAHPEAHIEVYRQNSVSIRIRIVDPDFHGKRIGVREDEVWTLLDKLPDETRADITFLLLITPEEKPTSMASFDFDNPVPSRL